MQCKALETIAGFQKQCERILFPPLSIVKYVLTPPSMWSKLFVTLRLLSWIYLCDLNLGIIKKSAWSVQILLSFLLCNNIERSYHVSWLCLRKLFWQWMHCSEQLPKWSLSWLGWRKCFCQYMHVLVIMSCNVLICIFKFGVLMNFIAHNSQVILCSKHIITLITSRPITTDLMNHNKFFRKK